MNPPGGILPLPPSVTPPSSRCRIARAFPLRGRRHDNTYLLLELSTQLRFNLLLWMFFVTSLLACTSIFSQLFANVESYPDFLPTGYKIEELNVTTRDGTPLHTVVVFPRGAKRSGNKYPTVMDRSPYGYGDLEMIANIYLPFGFVTVGQDLRGTAKSQGNFTMFIGDKDDSNDLGDWIVSQEWSNGQVFTFGASADGIASFQTIFNAPSWLSGQYIAWSPARLYNILFPQGTYKQETTEQWLRGIYMPTPEVVETNIQDIHDNEFYSSWWDQIQMSPTTYANVNFPSAFWAGWYDLFQMETLAAYEGYNTLSNPRVRYSSKLTIDPLGHCLASAEYFPQNAVLGRTGIVIGQALAAFGIPSIPRPNIKNVTFYVMSSNDESGLSVGQYWTSLETFPEPKMTQFFIRGDGSLSLQPPARDEITGSSSYVFDPSNPQTTNGGNNLPDEVGGSIPCGPLDQSEIDKRSDVLNFQTTVFTEELPLTGPLFATIYVSSDAIDTDFMTRVSDVYPTGEVRLLTDNAVRMRWRDGGVNPVYMEAGKVYPISMALWNTSYILAPGHALRVSISSSNNPRFSVNPNNGILLADPQYPGTNITAKNTLYHSTRYPSHVSLPVVTKRQLPEVKLIKEIQASMPHMTDEKLLEYTDILHSWMTNRRQRK